MKSTIVIINRCTPQDSFIVEEIDLQGNLIRQSDGFKTYDEAAAFRKQYMNKSTVQGTDFVNSPKHYNVLGDIEAKDIIDVVLGSPIVANLSPYQMYCLGNILKYRLRAGNKDSLEQDIAKADKYKEMGNLNAGFKTKYKN